MATFNSYVSLTDGNFEEDYHTGCKDFRVLELCKCTVRLWWPQNEDVVRPLGDATHLVSGSIAILNHIQIS